MPKPIAYCDGRFFFLSPLVTIKARRVVVTIKAPT